MQQLNKINRYIETKISARLDITQQQIVFMKLDRCAEYLSHFLTKCNCEISAFLPLVCLCISHWFLLYIFSICLCLLLVRVFETDHQEDGVEDEAGRDSSQSVHEHVQFGLFESVLLKPIEHLFFSEQVSSVDGRESASEVDESRKFRDSVFAGEADVLDLDKRNVQVVSLVIDVLQFLQYFSAFRAVIFIF